MLLTPRNSTARSRTFVVRAQVLGVCFAWVGMDGLYGEDPALLRALRAVGEIFIADVHKDQHIYLDDPRGKCQGSCRVGHSVTAQVLSAKQAAKRVTLRHA